MGSIKVTPYDHHYDFGGGIRYYNLSGVSGDDKSVNALSIDKEGRGQTEISLGQLTTSRDSVGGKEFGFRGLGPSILLGNLKVKGVGACSESSEVPSAQSAGRLDPEVQAAFSEADDDIYTGTSISLQKVISCEVEVSPMGRGGATVGGQSIELDSKELLTLGLNLTTNEWEVSW